MNPSELTVDQVVLEIEQIIQFYPDRLGGDIEEDGSLSCTYYKDEIGIPVSAADYREEPQDLATPVCIIGEWIQTFHPEWKEDEIVGNILRTNQLINHTSTPFTPEVRDVLGNVQSQQDDARRWGDIEIPN